MASLCFKHVKALLKTVEILANLDGECKIRLFKTFNKASDKHFTNLNIINVCINEISQQIFR